MINNFKILRINLVRNTSKVRAYVDVEYHGLALYGFSVVESNSNLIVFPPSKSANDRFYPVIDFRDPFVQKKFSEVILNGLKEYTTNNCESDRKAQ
jgi:DNA-binding cell septation regulator SpoVG